MAGLESPKKYLSPTPKAVASALQPVYRFPVAWAGSAGASRSRRDRQFGQEWFPVAIRHNCSLRLPVYLSVCGCVRGWGFRYAQAQRLKFGMQMYFGGLFRIFSLGSCQSQANGRKWPENYLKWTFLGRNRVVFPFKTCSISPKWFVLKFRIDIRANGR